MKGINFKNGVMHLAVETLVEGMGVGILQPLLPYSSGIIR